MISAEQLVKFYKDPPRIDKITQVSLTTVDGLLLTFDDNGAFSLLALLVFESVILQFIEVVLPQLLLQA